MSRAGARLSAQGSRPPRSAPETPYTSTPEAPRVDTREALVGRRRPSPGRGTSGPGRVQPLRFRASASRPDSEARSHWDTLGALPECARLPQEARPAERSGGRVFPSGRLSGVSLTPSLTAPRTPMRASAPLRSFQNASSTLQQGPPAQPGESGSRFLSEQAGSCVSCNFGSW